MKVLTLFVGILIVQCAFAGSSSSSSSSSSEESGSKKKGSSGSSSGGKVVEAEAKKSEKSNQSQKVKKETVTAVVREPEVVIEKRPKTVVVERPSRTTVVEESTPEVVVRRPRVVEYVTEDGFPYPGYPTISRSPYQGLPAYRQVYGPSYLRSQLSYRQPPFELGQAGLLPPLYRPSYAYQPAASYPSLPIRSLPYSYSSSFVSPGPLGYSQLPVNIGSPAAVSVGYPQTIVPQTVVQQSIVPQTVVPQTFVPQTAVPQTVVPQTFVPQTAVPQTVASSPLASVRVATAPGPSQISYAISPLGVAPSVSYTTSSVPSAVSVPSPLSVRTTLGSPLAYSSLCSRLLSSSVLRSLPSYHPCLF